MRKLILIVLFIAACIYFFSTRYEIKSGHSPDGTFHIVLMNKTSGKITQLMGGK